MAENILKVLEMVRDGAVSPEDGESLIEALCSPKRPEGVYVEDIRTPWPDDDKLHVAAFIGKKLITRQSYGRRLFGLREFFTLKLDGDARDVDCWGSLECGEIRGGANAGLHIDCRGGVGADARAGTHITCGGSIGGDASAGTHLQCGGDIDGNARAGTSVSCNELGGNATGGSGVHIRDHRNNGEKRKIEINIPDINIPEIKIPEINIPPINFNWGAGLQDDGKLRVAAFIGARQVKAQEGGGKFELTLDGGALDVECWGDMRCGNVEGDITAHGSLECGDVEGDINAGGSVKCETAEGDINAGGSISCGNVEGDVNAGNGVNCGNVEGSANAGSRVTCGNVGGDVGAGSDVECGNVDGSVDAGGGVTCGDVGGDVTAQSGDIHYNKIEGGATASGNIVHEN